MKLFGSLLLLISGAIAVQKVYQVIKYENCAGNYPVEVLVSFKDIKDVPPDKLIFNGSLEVKEKVIGPLELSFDASRCDFSMKQCEKYTVLKVILFLERIWRP